MVGLSNGTKSVEVVGVVRLIKVQKGLDRWFKEKWVDVSRKDKDGKHPPCGRSKAKTSSKGYPKCRPSVRVSSKTPKTAGEMTSGQKQAATKRKRSKRQGVKGKPTVVKGDPMDFAWRLLKDRKSPEAFRHKKEYDTKYESSPSRHKYRAELARERRKKGVMGHGGADMSHTRQHTIVPEDPHSNRARHFKERGTLKAEEPIERETLREVKALRRDVKKVIPPRHTPQKKDS